MGRTAKVFPSMAYRKRRLIKMLLKMKSFCQEVETSNLLGKDKDGNYLIERQN
jgi:hypothetical protein